MVVVVAVLAGAVCTHQRDNSYDLWKRFMAHAREFIYSIFSCTVDIVHVVGALKWERTTMTATVCQLIDLSSLCVSVCICQRLSCERRDILYFVNFNGLFRYCNSKQSLSIYANCINIYIYVYGWCGGTTITTALETINLCVCISWCALAWLGLAWWMWKIPTNVPKRNSILLLAWLLLINII